MTRYALVLGAFMLGAPAIAQEVAVPVPVPVDAPVAGERDPLAPMPPPLPVAVPRAPECAGESFVFAWGAGARPTRVTLCSEKGATTEEIIRMLQDAANQIDVSSLPEDRRTAIALQIRGKIAELQGKGAATLDVPARTAAPTLAPLARPAPAPVAPPVRTVHPAIPAPSARALPPAAPSSAASSAASSAPVAPVAAVPKPQLQFGCLDRGETGSGGPCTVLDRHSRLAATAVEELPAGTSLRFVRRGSDRAEVALGAMAKGQSTTLALPSALCTGVVQTQVEIHVVRGGQIFDRAGPFRLRC
jgi:hypothetical protein